MNSTVCCAMLANGREAMARRAIKAFMAQTYEPRGLLIWDSGEAALPSLMATGVLHVTAQRDYGQTIGSLRNKANACRVFNGADIVLHWDSDDWSHPRRIEEQVALLQSSGKEAVGYRDMLFWRETHREIPGLVAMTSNAPGEAWLYTYPGPPTYGLGTSLCYWRSVWEKHPFPDTSAGEDTIWVRDVDCLGISSVTQQEYEQPGPRVRLSPRFGGDALEPRMIASIHGANTYAKIAPNASEFRRVPEWDAHCREVMKL